MNEIFKDWEEIKVEGNSVPFYTKIDDGVKYIGFDSSSLTPPGPMVNAMIGLKMLVDSKSKLVMLNHKFPAGLIPKVEDSYTYESSQTDDGLVKVVFSRK